MSGKIYANHPELARCYCEGRIAGAASATRYASVVTGTVGAKNAITWTAKRAGNGLVVSLVNPNAASQSLAISVSGNQITASLATNSSSVITTTGDLLKTAVAAASAAHALVGVADYSTSDGTGAVVAAVATLTGSACQHPVLGEDADAWNAGYTTGANSGSSMARDGCAETGKAA